MVRSKIKPTRSIKDFDYGDQSVAFWFFSTGQQVPVPLKYKSKPFGYVPPIPPQSNMSSNGQAHNQQRNSNFGFNQDSNHVNSGKDKRNDKNKKFTKVLKGEESSNTDMNFSNDEYSDSISFKSSVVSDPPIKREKDSSSSNSSAFPAASSSTSNSINANITHPLSSFPEISPLTDIQLMITEAIIAEGGGTPGVSISFEKIYEYVSKKQRWKNVKRRDGSNYNTDCRRAIQANLRHNPHHLPLFKKDKSKLSQNNWMLIFTIQDAIDTSKEAFEGTASSVASKNTKRRETTTTTAISVTSAKVNNNTEDVQNESDEDEDEDDDDDYQVNNQSTISANTTTNNNNTNTTTTTGNTVTNSNNNSSSASSSSSNSRNESPNDKKLTDLQVLICECINDNGGSCHFDLIVHHVSKNWSKIKPTLNINSNSTDARAATLAALTDTSKRIFKRDTKKTGWWMINQSELSAYINSPSISAALHMDSNSIRVTPRSKSRKSRINPDVHSPDTIGSPDNTLSALDIISDQATAASSIVIDSKELNSVNTISTTPNTNPSTPTSDLTQLKKDKDAPSDLQVLIIKAIYNSPNGWATFDLINEQVSKLFDTVKRRDGAPYASDCKKAIQATLSNNPSTRPFFKKEVKRGVTLWGLAKRSTDFLNEEKRKPTGTSSSSSTSVNTSSNNAITNSISNSTSQNANPSAIALTENEPTASFEEVEEEIKDEDEINEDESPKHSDKEKDTKSTPNKLKRVSSPIASNLEGKRRRDDVDLISNAEGNTSDSLSSPSKNDRARKRRK